MVNAETSSRRARRPVLLALAACLTAGAPAGAEDAALTNFALLRRTAEEAVAEMLAGEPGTSGREVLVVPGKAHPHNWIVGELIGAELAKRGYRVHIIDAPLDGVAKAAVTPDTAAAPDDDTADMLERLRGLEGAMSVSADSTGSAPPPAATMPATRPVRGDVLEYRLGLAEVKYVDESRAFFLGPKRVQRGAAVEVTCRLKDAKTDDLLWVSEGAATYVDAIPKGKLALFESEGLAPQRVTGRGIMRVVEPVVVGGIVAGLVVLFYTNQN